MPLVIAASLARSVLPLSTRAFYGHLVSLNAAFFRVWRLTRRICLLDHLSFVCLASSSVPLRTYAIFPINQFRLASIPEPHSLAGVVLSTFKHIPEQSFAFCCAMQELNLHRFPEMELHYHYANCEPTKMCCSSCSIPC